MFDAKTELEQLQEKLDHLKSARELLESSKALKQELVNKLQASDEWISFNNQYLFATAEINDLETLIRNTALVMHDASMDIPEAITIKQFTVVEISDELKAKEWCIAHFTPALKLDTKVFEKAAKDGNIPAELATVSKEARAQIATKL